MRIDSPVLDFETFVTSGGYQTMKQHEAFLKQAKAHLREELKPLPGKRHLYPELNMVAKFVARKVQTTDHEKLIEDLFDYVKPELVLPILSLDGKRMKEVDMSADAAPFLLPPTYYVRPTLNKFGKRFTGVRDYLFGGQSKEELLTEIQMVTKKREASEEEYNQLKERLYLHAESEKTKQISTSIGSVSRIAHQPAWDMQLIYRELGEDFIKSFGKVSVTDLDEWVLTGRIPKSIVTKNRTVEDIKLDFIVMALDVEERILNIHNRKRSRLSLRRHA